MDKKKIAAVVAIVVFALAGVVLRVITDRSEIRRTWEDFRAAEYAGGEGTQDSPYLIETPEQLAKLAYDANSGVPTKDVYYKLANDIKLSQYNWKPIGENVAFEGFFNGGKHTITGLKIRERENAANYGLFGILGGEVKSLKIKNAAIGINFASARKNWQQDKEIFVGNLAGIITGRVVNVKITGEGEIEGAGKLTVGYLAGAVDGAQLENVNLNGRMIIENDQSIIWGGYAGVCKGAVKLVNCMVKCRTHYNSKLCADSYFGGAFGTMTDKEPWYLENAKANVSFRLKDKSIKPGGYAGCMRAIDSGDVMLRARSMSRIYDTKTKETEYLKYTPDEVTVREGATPQINGATYMLSKNKKRSILK